MDINTGLIAYYNFSNNVNDQSGNGNNATNNGGVYTTDKNSVSNQAIQLDGSNDYIDCGTFLNISSDFEISFWFNSNPVNNFPRLWSYEQDANNIAHLQLDTRTSTRELQFRSRQGGSNKTRLRYSLPSDNTWYHVVCGISGGSPFLYVNTNSHTSTASAVTPSGNSSLQLGQSDTASSQFSGVIDEVRIYTTVSDSDRRTELYNGYDSFTIETLKRPLNLGGNLWFRFML